jgi:hypothetical protein
MWSPAAAATALDAQIRSSERDDTGWPPGCRVQSIAARTDDVLVTFRWRAYPFTLAVAIPRHIPYAMWASDPSAKEWAQDAATWLDEELGTGLVARAARVERAGVIELVGPDRPGDVRFSLDSVHPTEEVGWDSIRSFEAAGFDTTVVRAARADRTLICWIRSYVNQKGGEYVGHAAVVRTDATAAQLLFCDLAPGVPRSAALDLCRQAAHESSWQGAEQVWTDIEDQLLDTLGFSQVGGRRELDTRFLDVDDDSYREVLAASRSWRQPHGLRSLISRLAVRVKSAPQ